MGSLRKNEDLSRWTSIGKPKSPPPYDDIPVGFLFIFALETSISNPQRQQASWMSQTDLVKDF